MYSMLSACVAKMWTAESRGPGGRFGARQREKLQTEMPRIPAETDCMADDAVLIGPVSDPFSRLDAQKP
jgi:hypothetical protein